MKGKKYRYTNKQYLIRGGQAFFSIIFAIVFVYILFNFNDFWEHNKVGVSFILILGITFSITLFRKAQGNEIKSDVFLSNTALMFGDGYRYRLSELELNEYVSEELHCFHLFNSSKTFTLYTNVKDSLIQDLLSAELKSKTFKISNYHFNRDSVVTITSDERILSFDLDTGKFSFTDNSTNEKRTFEPRNFVQTPKYRG